MRRRFVVLLPQLRGWVGEAMATIRMTDNMRSPSRIEVQEGETRCFALHEAAW